MREKKREKGMSEWFSTYGLVTAERILERFQIHVAHEVLAEAVKDSHNLYYQLLRVPLKNIFNGIILAQAGDYRLYAQKLYIEYLISGAGSVSEESPGATARADLERERLMLVAMNEAFDELDFAHHRLISDSQSAIIRLSKTLTSGPDDITQEVLQEIEQMLAPYIERAEAMNISLRDYRSQFYNLILRSTELIKLLPNYRPDIMKQLESLASLQFDAKIGEE